MDHSVALRRSDGGIGKGATIGVLLDFARRIVIFLINDEQQGPVAFEGLEGVYYPAISLNRNVQVQNHIVYLCEHNLFQKLEKII